MRELSPLELAKLHAALTRAIISKQKGRELPEDVVRILREYGVELEQSQG